MTYQDVWLNGKCIKSGTRECESRYEIIRDFCETRYGNDFFTICDIGANMSYFGLRLIEDFKCNVIAFEFHNFDMRLKHIEANKTNRLLLLNKKINLKELEILNTACQFDLVLAMSVIHHVKDNVYAYVDALRELGNNIILEVAENDSKRAVNLDKIIYPEDGIILGYGKSHLNENIKRKIILLENDRI